MLKGGEVVGAPLIGSESYQQDLSANLIVIAIFMVPPMLFAKPYFLYKQSLKSETHVVKRKNSLGLDDEIEMSKYTDKFGAIGSDEDEEEKRKMISSEIESSGVR